MSTSSVASFHARRKKVYVQFEVEKAKLESMKDGLLGEVQDMVDTENELTEGLKSAKEGEESCEINRKLRELRSFRRSRERDAREMERHLNVLRAQLESDIAIIDEEEESESNKLCEDLFKTNILIETVENELTKKGSETLKQKTDEELEQGVLKNWLHEINEEDSYQKWNAKDDIHVKSTINHSMVNLEEGVGHKDKFNEGEHNFIGGSSTRPLVEGSRSSPLVEGSSSSQFEDDQVLRNAAEKQLSRPELELKMVEMMQAQIKYFNVLSENQSATPVNDKFITRQTTGKDLPPFGGEPEQWPAFKAQYEHTTKACGFKDVENLYRLQKALKGMAKDVVQSLLTSPSNVPTIMKKLETLFGRPEFIIESLVKKAKEIPAAVHGRHGTILSFSNAISNLVTSIKTLNRKEYLMNPSLLRDLVNKLDPVYREKWGDYMVNKGITIPDLEAFSYWLDSVTAAVLLIASPGDVLGWPRKEERMQKREHLYTATTADRIIKCWYCEEAGHSLGNCREFNTTSVENRWKWVRDNGRCFSCLARGHSMDKCSKRRQCNVQGCKQTHNRLLHNKVASGEVDELYHNDAENLFQNASAPPFHTIGTTRTDNKVLLRIAPVTLVGPAGEMNTFAMFDEGATCTLLDRKTAETIGLSGESESLELKWTNGIKDKHYDSMKVNCEIKSRNGKAYSIIGARTIRNLQLPSQSVDVNSLKMKYPHLAGVDMESLVEAKPLILIGEDNIHLTIPRELKESLDINEPIASRSKLGWVIHGKYGLASYKSSEFAFNIEVKDTDAELNNLVRESFKLEALGMEVQKIQLKSNADIRAEELLNSTTRQISQNRWETGLLWKQDNFKFNESKSAAMRRLKCIENKMDKDENYKTWYFEKIQYYLDAGYCKVLSNEESKFENDRTYYLPHFATSNVNKPGKLRLVFDAAAQSNGSCLNDYLLKGPDQLNSLPGVLMRFRRRKYAFSGDVKEMFHQIRITDEDKNAQRFLWRGANRIQEPEVLRMEVMIFGAASSPCSAQYVMRKNADTWNSTYPSTANAIHRNIFMDDYLDSEDSEEAAIQRVKEVNVVQSSGGFEMLKWTSNSEEVLKSIPVEKRSEQGGLQLQTSGHVDRILGMSWDSCNDTIVFQLNFPKVCPKIVNGEKRPTKRDVLRLTMSLFDPLGFTGNFTVRVRILLQEIWRSKTDWDDEVTDDCWAKWTVWISEMEKIRNLKIPRCYSIHIPNALEINLHLFSDSSEQAYAAVCYLQVIFEDGIDVSFVMGKTRVAPLKPQSIPRLELQGALLACRMAVAIKAEIDMEITATTYWTDSRIVLCWIRSDARNFKQFVSNRVGEILEHSEVTDWKWVPTAENPADEGTRDNGITFLEQSKWLWGPDFLKSGQNAYPIEHEKYSTISKAELEMKKDVIGLTTTLEPIIDFSRYSSFTKVIRIISWILRWKKKVVAKQNNRELPNYLTLSNLSEAKITMLKLVQKECYPTEIAKLNVGEPVSSSSDIISLTPFIDADGLLKMRSRIEKLNRDCHMKKPIILDGHHIITKLMLQEFHKLMLHGGTETVLNEVRQQFWIPKLRTALKSVVRNCMWCRVEKARIKQPIMGPLPECRLMVGAAPFTYCGVDYFGPMTVLVGRRHEKRYGIVFTCMTTRAVSLDFCTSLDTNSCIMAIMRLAARRGGKPKKMFSDNGTNFVGANKELHSALKSIKSDELSAHLANAEIEWSFIPPSSPHMGGCWERMVKTVKSALLKTLNFFGKRLPTDELLRTLLYEVEHLVNSRPLTHVSLDSCDEEALTPNHFLVGSSGFVKPWGEFSDDDVILKQQWRKINRLADYFWNRWYKEYLPTLGIRRKWNENAQSILMGDLVFIVESGAPRGNWVRGIVVKLYPGKDGVIRVVDIKTPTGVFKRPVSKCAVMDVRNLDQTPSA